MGFGEWVESRANGWARPTSEYLYAYQRLHCLKKDLCAVNGSLLNLPLHLFSLISIPIVIIPLNI